MTDMTDMTKFFILKNVWDFLQERGLYLIALEVTNEGVTHKYGALQGDTKIELDVLTHNDEDTTMYMSAYCPIRNIDFSISTYCETVHVLDSVEKFVYRFTEKLQLKN